MPQNRLTFSYTEPITEDAYLVLSYYYYSNATSVIISKPLPSDENVPDLYKGVLCQQLACACRMNVNSASQHHIISVQV